MPNHKNETTVTVIPRLLTSADVAERLQVNIRTAQKIIRSIPQCRGAPAGEHPHGTEDHTVHPAHQYRHREKERASAYHGRHAGGIYQRAHRHAFPPHAQQ